MSDEPVNELHVIPLNDLIEHRSADDCPCGPAARPVVRDDGSMGWLQVHHSLDGREFREKDDEAAAS